MSQNDAFRAKFAEFVEKTKANAEVVTKQVAMDMLSSLVMKSPVGNPELWAANTHAMYARDTHNLWVDAINADLQPGEKKIRRLGQEKLKSTYKLAAGAGYVGGRFRGNWNVADSAPDESTTDSVDPSGGETISNGEAKILSFKIGGTLYLTNSLPYGQPLEYGHSTQSPAGMVRVTVAEVDGYFTNAVGGLDK